MAFSPSSETSLVHSTQSMCSMGKPQFVEISVDDSIFTIERELFTSQPNTMLGRMFGSCFDQRITKMDTKGTYHLDGDVTPDVFEVILQYYKLGRMTCPSTLSPSKLRKTCEYLLIPFNEHTVTCYNLCEFINELSNDGARTQFEYFLENILLRTMIICAHKGMRECHIVVLTDDDVVDWDTDYPPPLGEDYPETAVSSKLFRFLRYFENRDIAKQVLKERGFKKVKFGIEGFPTTKERVKERPNGKLEVIYNYVQRPFLSTSWEKQEAKSRHVDFTCIKTRISIPPDSEAATLVSPRVESND